MSTANAGGPGGADTSMSTAFLVLVGAFLVLFLLLSAYFSLSPGKFAVVLVVTILAAGVWLIPVGSIATGLLLMSTFRFSTVAIGSINAILLLIVIGVYISRTRASVSQVIFGTPLSHAMAVFCISQVVSILIDQALGQNHKLATVMIIEHLSVFLLFFIVFHEIVYRGRLQQILTAVTAVIAVEALVASLQLALPGEGMLFPLLSIPGGRFIYGAYSPRGTFFETELLSEFFAVSVPLLIAIARLATSHILRKVAYGLVGLSLFLLMTLGARGGVFALAIGFAAFFVLGRTIGRTSLRKSVGLALLVLAVAFAAVWLQRDLLPQFNYLMDEKMVDTTFEGAAPDSRSALWRYYQEKVGNSPLLGHGGLSIRAMFASGSQGPEYKWPHSLYLAVLYTSGLMGFIPLVYLFLRLLFVCISGARNSTDGAPVRTARLLMVAAVLAFVVDQYKIEYIRIVHYQHIIWGFFAVPVAMAVMKQVQQKAER